MKVLILTHGRSGGLSLANWIEKELKLELFHEPFIKLNHDLYVTENLFTKDNIVVKEFPFNIELYGFDVYDYIKLFDKLIIHKRENLRDTAISHVSGQYRNQDVKNKSNWHNVYSLDEEWIQKNIKKIEKEELELLNRNKLLDEIINNPEIKGLRTTYVGIFDTKMEIPNLLMHLNIENPILLDMLDNRHKLRNGQIGMNNYLLKPIIRKKFI